MIGVDHVRFNAVIFDLDGVLCSTDEYHFEAWKTIADKLGIPFDRSVNNRLRGVSRMESLDIILENYDGTLSDAEKQELAEEKNEAYKKLLENITSRDLTPQVKETLDVLRDKGLKLAIGSSSKNARFILGRLGLNGYFDAISDGNNITRSKPDPEVFLKAAGYVGEQPANCLVVEDAVSGAEAGSSAGMKVACVGDAAINNAGDYNLTSLSSILDLIA